MGVRARSRAGEPLRSTLSLWKDVLASYAALLPASADYRAGSWVSCVARQRAVGWLSPRLQAAMASSPPTAKDGGGSGGACMWGFVGAASFAAVRGLWGLVLGSDEDARFALDMQRRMEIRSAEDAFSNQSGVARRCWSACIEPVDGPSQPGGMIPVRFCFSTPMRRQSLQRPAADEPTVPLLAALQLSLSSPFMFVGGNQSRRDAMPYQLRRQGERLPVPGGCGDDG